MVMFPISRRIFHVFAIAGFDCIVFKTYTPSSGLSIVYIPASTYCIAIVSRILTSLEFVVFLLYDLDLIIPAMISKLFPSGCKSMNPSSPEDQPFRSGMVRSSPYSGVIPQIRTWVGGVVVVNVTS